MQRDGHKVEVVKDREQYDDHGSYIVKPWLRNRGVITCRILWRQITDKTELEKKSKCLIDVSLREPVE